MPDLSSDISTVLCDIDGVLRRWDAPDVIDTTHGFDAGTFARAAFDRDLLQAVVTGAISDAQWRDGMTELLTRTAGHDAARTAVAAWSEPCGTVDADVLAWIGAARASGRRVFLATNATSRLPSDLARLDLVRHVDGVINSSEVGVAKPDPAYYAAALRLTATSPDDCLFIDDRPENVDAATAVGMTGIRFIDASSLPRL